jgi:hypothetical protein
MSKVILTTLEIDELDRVKRSIFEALTIVQHFQEDIEQRTPTGEKYYSVLSPEIVQIINLCRQINVSFADIVHYIDQIGKLTK